MTTYRLGWSWHWQVGTGTGRTCICWPVQLAVGSGTLACDSYSPKLDPTTPVHLSLKCTRLGQNIRQNGREQRAWRHQTFHTVLLQGCDFFRNLGFPRRVPWLAPWVIQDISLRVILRCCCCVVVWSRCQKSTAFLLSPSVGTTTTTRGPHMVGKEWAVAAAVVADVT